MTCLISLMKLTSTFIAKAMQKNFITLYSILDKTLSDRDHFFTARFWKAIFQLIDIQPIMTTAYHQDTNGQLEQTNIIHGKQLRNLLNQQ